MKNKLKNLIKKVIENESGASEIVEATFVFPIIFFVLFFLIFFGNAYYVKANVDSVVSKAALKGALQVQDPYMEFVNGEAGNTTIESIEIAPYRYLFGGDMSRITNKISQEVKDSIKKSSGLLGGMNPKIKNSDVAKFNNKVLYSTFIVHVEYSIEFPWRFIYSSKPTIVKYASRSEEPVNDTVEFIRNTDMVLDMLDGNETYQKICDKFGKVKEFLENLAAKN